MNGDPQMLLERARALSMIASNLHHMLACLRAALTGADPVEALILLPMIGDAARLVQQIEALISARAGRG
jgi:hypothetical protein